MSLAAPAISGFIHATSKRRKNTWYSLASGNWTDTSIWMSNAFTPSSFINNQYPGQASATIATPVFPQIGDDVYISYNHTVTVNVGNSTLPLTVNNLFVDGILKADNSSRFLDVRGDIQVKGSVDFTSSNVNLRLYGVDNFITTFTCGTTSTVTYIREGDQYIMDLSYRNLSLQGATPISAIGQVVMATKYQTSNLTVLGNVILGGSTIATFEIGTYDLIVNGNLSNNNISTTLFGKLSKTDSGSIRVDGLFTNNGELSLTGNPSVECRGGFTNNRTQFNSGTGTWKFTTNAQNVTCGVVTPFTNTVTVEGAIAVTNVSAAGAMQINGTFDMAVAGGSLVNKGSFYWNNSSFYQTTTGTFDKDNFSTNIVGYVFNGSVAVPYTTYQGLLIAGTGTKTPSGNTVLVATLSVSIGGTFDMDVYDFTVGTSTLNSGTLKKTGAGSILFIGVISASNSNSTWVFSGNPSIELRGGISINNATGFSLTSGSGTWTFTTNNQSISGALGSNITINGNVVISGAITLTHTTLAGTSNLTIVGTLDGNNAASTFDNRQVTNYQNATRPMVTGVLQTNAAANTWLYNLNGNQDITGGTYRTLTLAGSGVKTLQGNVVVVTLYTLTAPATLNLNGFTRT